MTPFTWKQALAGSLLAGLAGAVASAPAAAQVAPPDFSSHQAGWAGMNGGGPFFEPVPGVTPGPVTTDPAHPFVPNGVGKQPTFRIADLPNPNLRPWVKGHMRKENEEVISGRKTGFTPHSSCQMAGVPMFMGYGGGNPIIFLQTPKEVWMYFSGDMQVRRVYLDVPHSANPKPSWYGESVGHYEGDTLVVDTIGLNDKTVAESIAPRTPTRCTWWNAGGWWTMVRAWKRSSPWRIPARSISPGPPYGATGAFNMTKFRKSSVPKITSNSTI
jgi:hypothetical protein